MLSKGQFIKELHLDKNSKLIVRGGEFSSPSDIGVLVDTNAVSSAQIINKQIQRIESINDRNKTGILITLDQGIWLETVDDSEATIKNEKSLQLLNKPCLLLKGEVVQEVIFDPTNSVRIGLKFRSGNFFSGCPSNQSYLSLGNDWRLLEKMIVTNVDDSDATIIRVSFSNSIDIEFPIKFPPPDNSNSCATYSYLGLSSFIVEFGSEHDSM